MKLEILIVKIKGINRVISTSKIKKITAIKKNCKEKGKRAALLGSNPHSNGEAFSRSINLFLEIVNEIIIRIKAIVNNIRFIKKIIMIIYTNS